MEGWSKDESHEDTSDPKRRSAKSDTDLRKKGEIDRVSTDR